VKAPLFFESAGDDRGTPQKLFDALNAEFHFDLDCAADSRNHKCDLWLGEGGIEFDALEADWGGCTGFLNPPYSLCGAFVKKARAEADKGATVVMLLPVRSDTKWWHDYVYDKTTYTFRPGVQCRLLQGRVNFELHVPDDLRAWIKSEHQAWLAGFGEQCAVPADHDTATWLKIMIAATGLPKMSVEGILMDYPDEDLLAGAPFPSCLVIFTKAA